MRLHHAGLHRQGELGAEVHQRLVGAGGPDLLPHRVPLEVLRLSQEYGCGFYVAYEGPLADILQDWALPGSPAAG